MELPINQIMNGDALQHLKELPDESINMVMTSPPYWALRDYGVEGQLGLERTFEEYINRLCDIFDEVKRVLKKDGTIWINIGDTYMGNSSYSKERRQGYESKDGMINKKQWLDPKYPHKEKLRGREHIDCDLSEKSLCMIPFRFALEMVNRGWILRNTIIWHKPNAMPSSVKDRFNVDFEYLFFFSMSKRYYFEKQYDKLLTKPHSSGRKPSGQYGKDLGNRNRLLGIGDDRKWGNEKGKNKRCVWKISTKPFKEAHFATYPEELCEIPIKAGCPEGGVVLDMFFGAGTTGLVALKQNKRFIGIELNPEYIKIAEKRLKPYLEQSQIQFVKVEDQNTTQNAITKEMQKDYK